ncbi:MAG: CARDB domain-containing protein [Candidatus Woesearchaeota archaeon]
MVGLLSQSKADSIQAVYGNTQLILTDKPQYTLGESVKINILIPTQLLSGMNVEIDTPASRYQLLDSNLSEVYFTPQQEGNYTIKISSAAGNLISSTSFLVLRKSEVEIPSSDSTSPKLSAKNWKGNYQKILRQEYLPANKKLSIEFSELSIQKIDFYNVSNPNGELKIEDVPLSYVENFSGRAARSFAIDPTLLEFTYAEIYFTATANELWKCREYDFSTRSCAGRYVKIMDTIPGRQYILHLTKEDPLYTEVWNNITCTCQNTGPNNGWAYCEVFCPVNIPIPTDALDGFIQILGYNVTITTSYPAGGYITPNSGMHYGFFDRDQLKSNGNESLIGYVAYDGPGTTTQLIYNTSMAPSGAYAFNRANCPTWTSGYCTWYVFLNSTAKSSKVKRPVTVNITLNSINWTWNYTTPAPSNITINLTSPADNTALGFRNVNFSYIPISSSPVSNCSLFINITGSWNAVATSYSIQNNSVNSINYTLSNDGEYLWNIRCYAGDISSFALYNRTLIVDTAPPSVTLLSPNNNSFSNTSIISFIYNVSDNFNIANCSLILDNVLVATSYAVTKYVPQNITYALSNGVHNWSITCFDFAGNFNISESRIINISAVPTIWDRRWYETSTSDYTSTANISLANLRDSTENSISVSVPVSTSYTLVDAISPYIGSNGAFVPKGTNVSFSGEFSTSPNAKGVISWFLYQTEGSTKNLLCNYGNGGSLGAPISSTTTASCTIQNDTLMLPTNRLQLIIIYYNNFKNLVSVTHYWDGTRLSFVEFSNFTTLGTLSVDLSYPDTDITVGQNELFNMSCTVNCSGGSCLNTLVYAQYNTSSTAFTNIGSSGNLILNTGETNPHSLGNINQSYTTTFLIKGNLASTNNIRCVAVSNYSNATGQIIRRVVVGDTTPPTVSLGNPANFSWLKSKTVTIYYTPSDNSGITNCSIYLNDILNYTLNSVPNGIEQNFTFHNLSDGLYNWTVACTDNSALTTRAAEKWFYIDTQNPSVELHQPENFIVLGSSLVLFNFTAYDEMAFNLSCNLTADNIIRISGINSLNSTPTIVNYTLSMGQHYWNVTCRDLAGNINTSETRTFNITNTPPEVTLISPPNNYWDRIGNITFIFNATDTGLISNCSLIINGQLNQTKNSTFLTNGINNFTILNMESGVYLWEVNCTDEGNLSTIAGPFTLNVDKSVPSVQLVFPSNYYNSSASSIVLQFITTDAHSANLSCNLTIDGILNSTDIIAQNNSLVSQPITFYDGIHNWSVSCSDLAGNLNSTNTWYFNISEKPSVSLSSPAPNAWTNGNVTFTFTASDNDGLYNCSLLINGAVYQTKNSSQLTNGGQNNFTVTNLLEGINQQWTVICFDLGIYKNFYSPSTRIFHVDKTPPAITLNYPADSAQIKQKNVSFNFSASDNFASNLYCNLSINGQINTSEIAVQSGSSVIVNVSGFPNGLYYWNVSCRDYAYNVNWSETNSFNVSVPPEVFLEYPLEGQWDNSENVTFYYLVTSNAELQSCSLIINGQLNQTDNSPVSSAYNNFTIFLMPEGYYTWMVNCTDSYWLTGSSNLRNLTIDRQAPWIVLNSPSNSSIVDSNYVTFNWTAFDMMADNISCDLYVDDYLRESEIYSKNGTPTTRTYIYSDGTYYWNVSCRDPAYNINWSQTYNFTVEAPPNVTLISPSNYNWSTAYSITFAYLPQDPIGIRQCTLYFDGSPNQTDYDIEANQLNYFTINPISEGVHTWSVNCTDSDWNTYMPPAFTLYIDRTPPTIVIESPVNLSVFSIPDVTFNFTAIDMLSDNISCKITINGNLNRTITVQNGTPYNFTIVKMSDNIHYWNVSCSDLAGNANASNTMQFTVSAIPSIIPISPANLSWSEVSQITFYFNATDNDGLSNCTLLINGVANQTKSSGLINGGINNITSTLTEGEYDWSIACTDSGIFYNLNLSAPQKIFVDLNSPLIVLYAPLSGSITENNSPVLNFTASDTMYPIMYCNITLDGKLKQSYIELYNNTPYAEATYNLSAGTHYWNVSCWDYVNHTGFSETWNFTVPLPDITVSAIEFIYNTTNPEEGKQLMINATVENLGKSNANNFLVQFFDGNPEDGGIQIGNNITMSLQPLSTSYAIMNWTASLGTHNIFVLVDPPIATNGTVQEENESNNIANKTILIQSWHFIYGNLSGELGLSSQLYSLLFLWNVSDANNSNIFAVDSDSNIDWGSLKPLGLDVNNQASPYDFSVLDQKLGMSNYEDSINSTYTEGESPKMTETFTIYGKQIENVPVAYSINSSNFKTGILWDTSDGNTYFNGTQDVVFVTKTNMNAQGSFDQTDYEMRIPSNLKNYIGSNPTVALYLEIR